MSDLLLFQYVIYTFIKETISFQTYLADNNCFVIQRSSQPLNEIHGDAHSLISDRLHRNNYDVT